MYRKYKHYLLMDSYKNKNDKINDTNKSINITDSFDKIIIINDDIDVIRFLDYLSFIFLDILKAKWSNELLLGLSYDYLNQVKISQQINVQYLKFIRSAKTDINFQGNKNLVLETLFLKMIENT